MYILGANVHLGSNIRCWYVHLVLICTF